MALQGLRLSAAPMNLSGSGNASLTRGSIGLGCEVQWEELDLPLENRAQAVSPEPEAQVTVTTSHVGKAELSLLEEPLFQLQFLAA